MNKHKMKWVSIFALIIMAVSYFIEPAMITVEAFTNTTLNSYTETIDTKITNLEGKISTTKAEEGFSEDKVLQNVISKLESDINTAKDNYQKDLTALEGDISLATLIDNSGSDELKTKYNTYITLGNTSPTLKLDSLEDITYEEEGETKTLITEDEIIALVISEYLQDDNKLFNQYLKNYDKKIKKLTNKYNNFSKEIDNTTTDITNFKNDVIAYENSEAALGNVPNLTFDNKNIYTILDEKLGALTELKESIDLVDFENQQNDLNEIKIYFNTLKVNFYNSNRTYQELGLDKEITNLEAEYKASSDKIDKWFTDKSLEKDFTTIEDNYDQVLFEILNETTKLDEKYNTLMDKIEDYTTRKPSDKEAIDNLLINLNGYYDKLSCQKISDIMTTIVDNADLTSEDNVDTLAYLFKLSFVTKETKDKIFNAKLTFYSIEVNDKEIFDIEIIDNKDIVVKGLKDKLSVTDFLTNLKSNGKLETNDNKNEFVDSKLELVLLEKSNKVLLRLNVWIQGDLNHDGIFNDEDLKLLTTEITKDDHESLMLALCDLDNDKKVTIKDANILRYFYTTKEELEEPADYKLEVVKTEEDNKIYYDLKLTTNQKLDGIEFKIGSTKDLTYKEMITDYNIALDDEKNPTKLVTTDILETGTIVRLVYEKNEKELPQTTVIVSDIILNDANLENIINTVSNVKEEPTNNENTNTNKHNVIQIANNDIEPEVEIEEEKEKDKNKVEVVGGDKPEHTKKEKIAYGNVIKIIVIVFLGVLIVYLINKNDNEEIVEEDNILDDDDKKKNTKNESDEENTEKDEKIKKSE